MKHLLVYIFFLLAQLVTAQNHLKIYGLEEFNFNTANKVINEQEAIKIAQDIRNNLIEESYLAANIDSITNQKDTFSIFFTPNEKYNWANLSKGNLEEELVGKIDLSGRLFLNRPFSSKNLNQLFDRTVSYFENNGYPFASISLDSVSFNRKNEITAALRVEKNQFYKIDSILIEGNSGISENYLLRHLGLSLGQAYNEKQVSEIETRLRELPFVNSVKKPQVQFFDDYVKVVLDLKKKKASRFDGVLGLLTDENDGTIEVTGDIDLNLINALNRGENIELNWRKLKGNSQDLNIGLAYPYFLNSAFGIDFRFKLFKRDTTFIDLNTRLGLNYNLRRAEYITLFIENKASNLLSKKSLVTNSNGNLPSIGDVRINLFGVGYRIERLDYRYNPSKGFSLETNFAAGNKRLIKINALLEENPNIYDDVKLRTLQYNGFLKVQKFFKIKNRSSFLVANQSASTYSDNLYFNELLRIGGLKLLRGFDEESINVSSYSIFTLEYRFLLDRNSFFSLFTDGGYYEASYLDEFSSDTPFGIGAGVSFETNAGIFTINYAVGKQFDNPIDLRSAKIHFGFINFF